MFTVEHKYHSNKDAIVAIYLVKYKENVLEVWAALNLK